MLKHLENGAKFTHGGYRNTVGLVLLRKEKEEANEDKLYNTFF